MNLILLQKEDFTDNSNERVRIRDHRMQHVLSVCKTSVGEVLKVGLYEGLMGTAIITKIEDSFIEMDITLNQMPPPPLPVTLILALPRPKTLKKTLELASTVGIKKIYIIESWRVEKSYWASPVLNNENLENHICLGLEQARDTIPPKIEFRRKFKPFVQDELPDLIQGNHSFVAHPYGAIPCPRCTEGPVVLAVGPEGGFIPYEIDQFRSLGFKVISTGERILRVEQAVAVLCGRLF